MSAAPFSVIWFEGTPEAPVKRRKHGFADFDAAQAWAEATIVPTTGTDSQAGYNTLPNVDEAPYTREWTNQWGATFALFDGRLREAAVWGNVNRFGVIVRDKSAVA